MTSDSSTSCCTTAPDQPPARDNPPGQSKLIYRVGTHPSFLRRMIQSLPRAEVTDDQGVTTRPLRALTTRADDDGTIALLDAWAAALDVLTFYGERILNEGYLSTAVEQRSVVELARAIGYQPSAGVAASTKLAFTIDAQAAAQTADGVVTVPQGLPVMSVPGQDELPQIFETGADLEGRADWNTLIPVHTRPHPIGPGTTVLYLAGATTRLAVGDPIVVVGSERSVTDEDSERWDLRVVAAVDLASDASFTLVTLDRALGDRFTDPAAVAQTVLTFRGRASLFGANAPDINAMSSDIQDTFGTGDRASLRWDGFKLSEDEAVQRRAIDLDREYPSVVQGSWICLQDRLQVELYEVTQVSASARTDFTLAGKCTRLKVDTDEHLADFHRRQTVVHIQSESLDVAEAPFDDPVEGAEIELDGLVTEMSVGRTLIFTGTDADVDVDVDAASADGVTESATVAGWGTSADGLRTIITLGEELQHRYVRATLVINGNVVDATHGSTVSEVLGSGDGGSTHQTFALKSTPLTWIPASTARGAAPTLEVRVDGILWEEVDSLHDQDPDDRVYVLRRDEAGATIIEFGDGKHGARLPSGANNVTAGYRKGLGLDGEVDAGRLSLLQQRPLGVRGVTNPDAAGGAADPDDLESTRENAPLGVLTLDRLVSLQDYEDFARAFAGIGKARGVELWDGKRAFVHVTVASASGEELDDAGDTMTALKDAFTAYQDPAHIVSVSPHQEVRFGVGLKLLRDDAHTNEDIEAAVREALIGAFSFTERQFGQSVTAAEVITVAQDVDGVTAVDLDVLYLSTEAATPHATLTAARAVWSGGAIGKAQLLLVDAALIAIDWMDA